MRRYISGRVVGQWRLEYVLLLCLVLVITSYFLIYTTLLREEEPGESRERKHENHPRSTDLTPEILANISRLKVGFHLSEGDVLVFMHVQKSGGTTFNSHLVNLRTSPPCDCSTEPPEEGACRCRNAEGYTWLFSRFTTSSSCGVHPPYPDLSVCVPKFLSEAEGYATGEKHRFLYTTVLRDPINRYISEWKHVQREGPWPSHCTEGSTVEICMKNYKHKSLDMEEFTSCRGNPANNRQVRMLGSYAQHQCSDLSELTDQTALLQKAKTVLQQLAFFGLTEEQVATQRLFEWTFDVKFGSIFRQENNTIAEKQLRKGFDDARLEKIRQNNNLDVEFYKYAKQLFHERCRLSDMQSSRR